MTLMMRERERERERETNFIRPCRCNSLV